MNGNTEKLLVYLAGSDKRFSIPVYQRKYDWRQENCKQLYDDLIKVIRNKRPNHFFGSIVSEFNPDGYKNERVIIDGQQRLTTVSLLLLAIHNLLEEGKVKSNNPSLMSKVMNEYLSDPYDQGQKKYKLILVRDDRLAYYKLFEDKSDFISDSHLTINYEYFYNRIQKEEITIDELDQAISKLQIINLTLNAEDNAQLIFESLNSTGKDLDESDKIRNYILMNKTPVEQTDLYDKYWNKIEKLTGENLNSFTRDYLSIKTNSIPSFNRVYTAFKEYTEENNLGGTELLTDMLDYAKQYYVLLNGYPGNKSISGCITRLNLLETTIIRPFLMEVLRLNSSGKLTIQETEEVFIYTENYIFRRLICSVPTNALNKIFLTMNKDIVRFDATTENYASKYKYILANKKENGRFPDDEEFINNIQTRDIYHLQAKNKAYIFERIENFGTKEDKDIYRHIEDGTYSIEHIMPQHLTDSWRRSLGKDSEEIHEIWLHRLANLTLTAYNSKYSNDTFENKKTMENGFIESGLKMNQKISHKDSWGLPELEERNADLAKEALKIWKYPETDYVPPVKEMDTVGLEDNIDLTGRMIAKFSYLGNEQPVESWNDMYERVIRMLHNDDKSVLARLALSSDCTYVSHNPNALREPSEIDQNIYIEKHGNTSVRISRLIRLFNLYGVNTDTLTFYLKDESVKENIESDRAKRHRLRKAYWEYALPLIKKANAHEDRSSFSNCVPTTSNTTSGYFGIAGFCIACSANYDDTRVDFLMRSSNAAKNKNAFDLLYSHKEEIEEQLGTHLVWDKGENSIASSVSCYLDTVSLTNEADWPRMARFHAEWSDKLCEVILPYLLQQYGRNDKDKIQKNLIRKAVQEWAEQHTDLTIFDYAGSGRIRNRFTTKTLSAFLPDTPDALSGWDTPNHYFYEIRYRDAKRLYIQLAFSSKNLPDEQRRMMNDIASVNGKQKSNNDWTWWIVYRTEVYLLDSEDYDTTVRAALDNSYQEILRFEERVKNAFADR